MTLISRAVVCSLVLSLVGALPAPAQAQTMDSSGVHPFHSAALTADGYYAHYRFDRRDGDHVGMNGVGARLMWRPAVGLEEIAPFWKRFSIGAFGEYVPDQDKGFSVGHVGAQTDVNLLATPWLGRVAPMVSLGAGVLWTDRVGPAIDSPEFVLGNRSTSMFALSPAVSVQVGLWRHLGLRADARDVITFRDQTRHNVQFAGGLSLPF